MPSKKREMGTDHIAVFDDGQLERRAKTARPDREEGQRN